MEYLFLAFMKELVPPMVVYDCFRACSCCGLGFYHSCAFMCGSLKQVGIALKPFLPQLQTTFTKALQDSNRGVRLKAADALGKLISIPVSYTHLRAHETRV